MSTEEEATSDHVGTWRLAWWLGRTAILLLLVLLLMSREDSFVYQGF